MLVLATDYSELDKYFYAVVGFFCVLNAGLFLAYFSFARPRGLARPFPKLLIPAALAFTIIGPIGFIDGLRLFEAIGGGGRLAQPIVMAGIPTIIGSLVLAPFLKRDFRSGFAWLAPVIGIAPTLVLVALLPSTSTGGTSDFVDLFFWPVPWHASCAVAFMTAGRRAWNAELRLTSACRTCGYARQDPTTSTCPECGGRFVE